ncbi:MAG: AarF/UbiB family protein [Candidatus Edwardsbacteria bacterium]
MLLPKLFQQYRNLKRYRQIIKILMNYGFAEILERLNLTYYFEKTKQVFRPPKERKRIIRLSLPQRIRLACEKLGPTFVKLGQIASTRPDLFPPEFIRELQELQDQVAPLEFSVIKSVVEQELESPLENVFSSFEEKSIASASIAQVHQAKTWEGERVVVKVQRPDSEEIITTDLAILLDLTSLLERRLPQSRLYQPRRIVEEFTKTMEREIDFLNEGRNIERFARNFAGDSNIYIPKVYWNLSTSKVLTLEKIEGIKISEIEKLKEAGLDPKIIAARGAEAILKQIFIHGFFHADPHPGNIFVLEDNVLALLDYGMIGRIDPELMDLLAGLFVAVMKKDISNLVKIFLKIGIVREEINEREFRAEVREMLERYYAVPLNKIEIRKTAEEIMSLARHYAVRLPADLVLLGKALSTTQGLVLLLNPEFNFVETAEPFLRELMKRQFSLTRLIKDFSKEFEALVSLIKILPEELEKIIKRLAAGQLKIEFEHKDLRELIEVVNRASNRLAFALIIAGLIVASSLIMQLNKGPLILGFPILGVFGFILAGILGLWLIFSILRSGRL